MISMLLRNEKIAIESLNSWFKALILDKFEK